MNDVATAEPPRVLAVPGRRRRGVRRVAAALAAAMAGTVVVVAVQAPASAEPSPAPGGPAVSFTPAPEPAQDAPPDNLTPFSPDGTTSAEQTSIAAATAKATTSGKPVTVDALTTETQVVTAQPSGGLALTANPIPVRTKQHGAWVPVDTTLRRNADGSWSPAATAFGTVRFSNGGSGPLAVTSSGGTRFSLSWPSRLPAPTITGSTATYANVLPGVNLVVSATVTGGLSDTLVITSAAAAHNPALARLTLPAITVGGSQRAGNGGDSIAVAAASGGRRLDSGTPLMWDSHTDAPSTAKNKGTLAPDRSDVTHPGLAAHVAAVHTTVSGHSLTLAPDRAMLTAATTTFPVYVDPTLNWHEQDASAPNFDEIKSGSPCNGASYWDNTGSAGNYGMLGVGWNGWPGGCDGIERAMYQWKIPTVVWGSTVHDATVNATEVYASQCSTTSTVNLHETGGIGPGTDWNNHPNTTGQFAIGLSYAPASNPDYCPNNNNVAHAYTVTSRMAVAAAQHWTQWTISLQNDADESSHNRNGFKRFSDNPTLAIYFDRTPATPTSAVMSARTGSTNAGCATATPYPIIGKTVVSNPPTLNTTVTDPDSDKTQATFQYWIDGTSTKHTGQSGDNLANKSTATYGLPSSFTSALTDNQVVDWQARVTDGLATSNWSTICHFTVLPTGPDAPEIQPNDTYPDTSTGGGTGAAAGTTALWQLRGAATGTPPVKYVYGFDQRPPTSNPPTSQIVQVKGTALDTPAGRWQLSALPIPPEGWRDSSGNNNQAFNHGATWAIDPIHGGHAVFDGATAYAATSGPILDTTESFSVAAWVKLNSLSGYQTAVSQDGSVNSGFYLQYNLASNRWAFARQATDTSSTTTIAASSSAAPTTGSWTHLVGVFDASTGKMSLYVNGALAGTATDPTPFAANGPLAIGRGLSGGTQSNFVNGAISDVQVYSRTLSASDVQSMYAGTEFTATPLAPGPHTLYVHAVDAAGDVSGDDAYQFIAAGSPNKTCDSLAACFNNTAISPDNNTSLGHADGAGNSYSATDLANAGWTSGGTVTINGAQFTLPAYGAGQPDNVLAANQTITYDYSAPLTGLSALEILASSTDSKTTSAGAISDDSTAPYVPAGVPVSGQYCFDSTNPAAFCPAIGTVNYLDNSAQTYDLTVPDWVTGPNQLPALLLPHRNTPTGQQASAAKLFTFSIPLVPGKEVTSITLPDVGSTVSGNTPSLHIFGLSVRDTTTVGAPDGQSWTGGWASPIEGLFGYSGSNFSNLTIRTTVTPSVSGATMRIKLDNATGTNALAIGHATVARADHTGMTNLKFSGNAGINLPGGGMAFSDPLPFAVTAGQPMLVSFSLTNTVAFLPENTTADTSYTYISANGSGDHTTDTSEASFTGSGTYDGYFTDVLTGVDITTAGVATQTLLGDGLIDKWRPKSRADVPWLRGDLANDVASTPNAYGLLAGNIESNEVMTDQWGYGGPSLLSRVDRDILDEPGLTSVILDEGLEDLLRGQDADNLTTNGYSALLTYLQTDNINIIVAGLSPCDGYAGDGSSSNDACSDTVDANRTATNGYLSGYQFGLNPYTTPQLFYVDTDAAIGVPDPDAPGPETKLAANADRGDHVNLTPAGYGALTSAYLGAQDIWPLDDGLYDPPITGARDTATNTSNPYLLANPTAGQNPATLYGTGTWPTDPTRGDVLSLDGTSGYAASDKTVLDTAQSYSVSAWVKLGSLPTRNATIAAQDGNSASGFYLQYNYTHANTPGWAFTIPQSDADNPTFVTIAVTGATTDWTHLVGVYNATTHTSRLYVNGALAAETTNVTDWQSTGSFTIGRGRFAGNPTDFLPGELSDVRAWNYAVSADQVTALTQTNTPASYYQSITPTRYLDTRTSGGPVTAGSTTKLKITDTNGVPANNVTAVALNITATTETSSGSVRVYPDNTPLPLISNMNYTQGVTTANYVITAVGDDGYVDIYNDGVGTTQFLVDVSGYFTTNSGSPTSSSYMPVTPTRILDTRSGLGAPTAPLTGGKALALKVTGAHNVPTSGVTAVVINLLATNPTASGFLTAYADGTTRPATSSNQYRPGTTTGDTDIVPVGANGEIDVYASATTDVLADISGYFTTSANGMLYHSVSDSRLLDTRLAGNALPANTALQVLQGTAVFATNPVMIVNITATQPAVTGYATVYADGAADPGTSNIDWVAGATVPSLALAQTNNAAFDIYNHSSGTVHIIIDCLGYFSTN